MPLPRPQVARFGLLGLVGLLIALAPAASARAQAFADFNDISSPSPTFAATNNQGSSLALNSSSMPVSFSYDPSNPTIYNQIATNYPSLTGPQAATVTYTASTTEQASSTGGIITQLFNGPMTIQFLLTTPFNGKSNLLTATISLNAEIIGPSGGQSSSFLSTSSTGSLPATITYTSDFFNVGAPSSESISIALTGLSSSFSMGAGDLLGSFESSQIGNFSSYYPLTPAVPVPASLLMLSSGLLGLPGLAVLRRLRPWKATPAAA